MAATLSSVAGKMGDLSGSIDAKANEFERVEGDNEAEVLGALGLGDGIFGEKLPQKHVHTGVKITDFSMFTDMSAQEFFQYMSNGGKDYFGIDQGSVKLGNIMELAENDSSKSISFFGEQTKTLQVAPEYTYLVDFLTGRYGFSKKDSTRVLSIVDSLGACSYASNATTIAYEYRDKPERFEQKYGFPLYIQSGKKGFYSLNGEQLLTDIYVFSNCEENVIEGNHFFDGKVSLFLNDGNGGHYINESNVTDSVRSFYANDETDYNRVLLDQNYSFTETQAQDQIYYGEFYSDPTISNDNIELFTKYIHSRDDKVTVRYENVLDYDYRVDDNLTTSEMKDVFLEVSDRIDNGESILLAMGPGDAEYWNLYSQVEPQRGAGCISLQGLRGYNYDVYGSHAMYATSIDVDDKNASNSSVSVATYGIEAQVCPFEENRDDQMAGWIKISSVDLEFDSQQENNDSPLGRPQQAKID